VSAAKGLVRTKRWNDPVAKADGTRLLVSRYRPRGLRRERENWDDWLPKLGPSRELHALAYGKSGEPLPWEEYRVRYLAEMQSQAGLIGNLARRVGEGETITLLCSSACTEAARCHRTLLQALVYEALGEPPPEEALEKASPTSGLSDKLRKWLS
jgi:uncharacterized protein YeaO (DUF488 family)